ncbi:MAG: rRNA maturation RNase YbeY [Mycoplasmataceae bacterium]|jgi:probable rRNA maturation factor|nr:rRNA maturation RNase YbeY [Mycoplasmataceae bacterium]
MLKFTCVDEFKLLQKGLSFYEPRFAAVTQLCEKYMKDKDAELMFDVVFTTEKKIIELNHKYRKKNESTDVISFAFHDDEVVKTHLLGEFYICVPFVEHRAEKEHFSFDDEIILLFLHGLLHLLGFDHQTKKDFDIMFNIQKKILEKVL